MLRKMAKDGAFAFARVTGPRVDPVRAILMYHDIGGAGAPGIELFVRQMDHIVEHSRVVPLHSLPEAIEDGGPLTVVTFDDGYARTIETVAPVLAGRAIRATFFVPSGLLSGTLDTSYGPRDIVGEAALRALAEDGHEIGGHTRSHPKLTTIPEAEARAQIQDDRAALTDLLGAPPASFAYPKGDHDERTRSLVRGAGYRLAVTVREDLLRGVLDPWGLPRILVNGTMGMTQFRAKLSGGLLTYERLRGRR